MFAAGHTPVSDVRTDRAETSLATTGRIVSRRASSATTQNVSVSQVVPLARQATYDNIFSLNLFNLLGNCLYLFESFG